MSVAPVGIYLLKVNNRNTGTRCERNKMEHWNMFKVNNNDTRTTPLAYTYFTPCSSVSVVNFEQANADWSNIASFLSKVLGQYCEPPKRFQYFSHMNT